MSGKFLCLVWAESRPEIRPPVVPLAWSELVCTHGASGYVAAISRSPQLRRYSKSPSSPAIHEAEELTSFAMSYSKKDEDADTSIMRVDRTSVFQEGWSNPPPYSSTANAGQHDCSIPPLSSLENAESF